MDDDLAALNAARGWWQDHIPDIGRMPTDDEVLEAYANRDQPDPLAGMALRRLQRLRAAAAADEITRLTEGWDD